MSTTSAAIATSYNTRSSPLSGSKLYRVIPTLTNFLDKICSTENIYDKINWVHKLYIIINTNMRLICDNKSVALVVYETAVRLRAEIIESSADHEKLNQRAKFATNQMDKFIDYYLDNVWEHDIMLK